MYTIYFTNHGYTAGESFDTLDEAVAYAKRCHFDAAILKDNEIVAAWGAITGFRMLVA